MINQIRVNEVRKFRYDPTKCLILNLCFSNHTCH